MAASKSENTSATHVVDILGNVIGRDQPLLLIERALDLISSIEDDSFRDDSTVFIDPFCKAGELLLACAIQSCKLKWKDSDLLKRRPGQVLHHVEQEIYLSGRYYGIAPDERHHRLSLRTFLGNNNSHKKQFSHVIQNGDYLSETDGNLRREKFEKAVDNMLEFINTKSSISKVIAVGNPPCLLYTSDAADE